MPNAKDASRTPTKILAVGRGGSGKTTLFLTHPAKRKFMYIFDPAGLNSIQGFDIDYEVFLADPATTKAMPLAEASFEKGLKAHINEPLAYIKWQDHFDNAIEIFFNVTEQL